MAVGRIKKKEAIYYLSKANPLKNANVLTFVDQIDSFDKNVFILKNRNGDVCIYVRIHHDETIPAAFITSLIEKILIMTAWQIPFVLLLQ